MTVNDYNEMRVPDDTEKNYFSMSLRFCRLTTIGIYNYKVSCRALLSRLLKSRTPAYSFKIHLILASQTSVTTLLRDALQEWSSQKHVLALVLLKGKSLLGKRRYYALLRPVIIIYYKTTES